MMPSAALKRIRWAILRRLWGGRRSVAQRVCGKGLPLVTLGDSHGAWTVLDHPKLQGGTILSCGVGEDMTFDLEFAQRYGARVVLVDPTSRAIQHFTQVTAALSKPNPTGDLGKYERFKGIDCSRLLLIEKAVWHERGSVRFYAPQNPTHVSHSITNLQQSDRYVEVDAITVRDVAALSATEEFILVKLDIEGAEIPVLRALLSSAFEPHQILVEFDEMLYPKRSTRRDVIGAIELLEAHGYTLVSFDGRSNCGFAQIR